MKNEGDEPPKEPRKFPNRKRPDDGVLEIPGQSTILFVTACTKNRERILANDRIHQSLRETWMNARGWLVGKYTIMPDHVHFFASPGEIDVELDIWMRYWKKLHNIESGNRIPWLARHWDTRMRSKKHYAERWAYVRDNPVRQGLVKDVEEWPYTDELFELNW